VGTARIAETSMDEVVAQMVGRTVQQRRPAPPPPQPPSRPPALQVVDLSLRLPAPGARAFAVRDVSLSVGAGEVVAVCGAMGSGRTALLSTLFGAGRGDVVGEVRVDGVPVRPRDPRQAIDHGLALLPEDRKGQGLVLSMSVAENLALPGRLGAGKKLHREAEAQAAARLAERLGLRTLAQAGARDGARAGARGDVSLPTAALSGGNQQKVALGKWMATPPRVLLLDEPTRGVDIGAREEIYALIESLCQTGVGVLLASSDLQEVLRLAHRVVVLRDGAVAGVLEASPGPLTQEDIVRLSTGAQA
jgi:ABC-type sugar transport system ATPase subunit